MMKWMSAVTDLATALWSARTEGGVVPREAAKGLVSVDAAYGVQREIASLAAQPRVGWKVGTTSIAAQRLLGTDAPSTAPMFADHCYESPVEVAVFADQDASIECEFAFRFAREEARRTGIIHGVTTDIANDLVSVFRLDEGPNPNDKVFDVRHPMSKQLYAIQIGEPPYSGVTLSADGGQMVGTCDDPGNIAFDATGVVRCVEPTSTRINSAYVDLAAGQLTLTVSIDSFTGRVSMQ